jgi:hypothetical protein
MFHEPRTFLLVSRDGSVRSRMTRSIQPMSPNGRSLRPAGAEEVMCSSSAALVKRLCEGWERTRRKKTRARTTPGRANQWKTARHPAASAIRTAIMGTIIGASWVEAM